MSQEQSPCCGFLTTSPQTAEQLGQQEAVLQARPTTPHHHIGVRTLSFLPVRCTAVAWVGREGNAPQPRSALLRSPLCIMNPVLNSFH